MAFNNDSYKKQKGAKHHEDSRHALRYDFRPIPKEEGGEQRGTGGEGRACGSAEAGSRRFLNDIFYALSLYGLP